MPPNEGEELEEVAPIDIKSRIAAFSQGVLAPSTRVGPAPAVSRLGKPPTLRKVPSTSQLLPAWQQQQQQLRQRKEDDTAVTTFLKPDHAASTRPRANTGDESRLTDSPKLGVKSIIALYGQQAQISSGNYSSELQSRSREASFDDSLSAGQLPSPRASSMDILRRAVPPPALPPRPKISNTLISQTNTGSSSHSASSNGVSTSAVSANGSPATYAPYLRKGNGASQLAVGSSNGTESPVPALPRRLGTAHSVEDLTLDPSHSSLPSSAMRKLGSGPKWASSSSGNLTMQGETSGTQSSIIAPAVPPRVSASATNSPSSFAPPPPKRTIPLQSPVAPRNHHRSTTATSYGSTIPSPVISSSSAVAATATASPNGASDYTTRSAKSSLTGQLKSNNSPIIAPPPRHVDIRRKEYISHSSTSSFKSAKRHERKRLKSLQAGVVYVREPGDAEQRYTLLFYRLLKDQQAKTASDTLLLNKKTVVRIWKQSQLENWFLANVWEAAATTNDGGVGKAAFTRAMSAIDYELSRRQAERQSRTTH